MYFMQKPRRTCRKACSFAPPGAAALRFAAVFAPCGDAAADMPFRLVFVQDLLDLEVEGSVVEGQALLYILMYGYH